MTKLETLLNCYVLPAQSCNEKAYDTRRSIAERHEQAADVLTLIGQAQGWLDCQDVCDLPNRRTIRRELKFAQGYLRQVRLADESLAERDNDLIRAAGQCLEYLSDSIVESAAA